MYVGLVNVKLAHPSGSVMEVLDMTVKDESWNDNTILESKDSSIYDVGEITAARHVYSGHDTMRSK